MLWLAIGWLDRLAELGETAVGELPTGAETATGVELASTRLDGAAGTGGVAGIDGAAGTESGPVASIFTFSSVLSLSGLQSTNLIGVSGCVRNRYLIFGDQLHDRNVDGYQLRRRALHN